MDPAPDKGCSVVEATIALACSTTQASIATQAKREISRLWDDINRSPYKLLFHPGVTYLRVWRAVQVMRSVDTRLGEIVAGLEGRKRGIVVHGNRLLLHLVFRQLDLAGLDDPRVEWTDELAKVGAIVDNTVLPFVEIADTGFPGYPASLFKNATKSTQLASRVLARLRAASADESDMDNLFDLL